MLVHTCIRKEFSLQPQGVYLKGIWGGGGNCATGAKRANALVYANVRTRAHIRKILILKANRLRLIFFQHFSSAIRQQQRRVSEPPQPQLPIPAVSSVKRVSFGEIFEIPIVQLPPPVDRSPADFLLRKFEEPAAPADPWISIGDQRQKSGSVDSLLTLMPLTRMPSTRMPLTAASHRISFIKKAPAFTSSIDISESLEKPAIQRVDLRGFTGLEHSEHEVVTQKIHLGQFTGLEKTEYAPPKIAEMDLKDYKGLGGQPEIKQVKINFMFFFVKKF